jgi:hypothetical protein
MKPIRVFLILVVLFIFSSCATNNYTYDKTVQEEQQCILLIPKDFTVVKFNELKVNWKVGYNIFHSLIDNFSQKEREASVTIPEGKHTLTINYKKITNTQVSYNLYKRTTSSAEGIEVIHDFQHGDTYTLIPWIIGDRITIIVRKH